MRRRGIGILGNAVSKGPIFARDLNKVDENVLFAHPLLGRQKLGDTAKECLLLLYGTPEARVIWIMTIPSVRLTAVTGR